MTKSENHSNESRSPRPWRFQSENFDSQPFYGYILDDDGMPVCEMAWHRGAAAAKAAFIITACNAHDELVAAAQVYLKTNPPFRSKPMGGEGSQVRLHQEDCIAAADALSAALLKAGAAQ